MLPLARDARRVGLLAISGSWDLGNQPDTAELRINDAHVVAPGGALDQFLEVLLGVGKRDVFHLQWRCSGTLLLAWFSPPPPEGGRAEHHGFRPASDRLEAQGRPG